MKRTRGLLAISLVLGLSAPVLGNPPRPIGHGDLAAEHRSLPRASLGGLAPDDPRLRTGHLLDTVDTAGGPIVAREVMGYLPYWSYTANSPYVPLRWDLLTILAWFAVSMDETGDIVDRNGWGGATTARIVSEAQARGVKVIITITNFSDSQIATLVNSPVNRARAIATCLSLMDEHSADGINIDFEFVPRSGRDGFVTFMTELKDAVSARAPNGGDGHVSLAGPAVDWTGAYDYDVLLENTDGIMVMAYGYHWSGGPPGPTAPLESGDLWSSRSIAWTVDDYLTYGGVDNRAKVLIGLPWYGRSWEVANTAVPGTAIGGGSSKTFRAAEPEALAIGKGWEDISKSVYYHKTTGGVLSQIWYDDGPSFQAKVAYVDEMDLGGIGIWALGYEGGYPDLWDAVAAELVPADPGPGDGGAVELVPEPGPEPVTEPGPEPLPEPGPELVPEPTPETGDASLADAQTPETRVLTPSRSVSARELEGEGCASSSSAALTGLLALLLCRRYFGFRDIGISRD
jgi:spore germination protein YaaH